MSENVIELLSVDSRVDIDRWIAKYPAEQKQSAVMAGLRIAQEQNGGWLTDELIQAVAAYLESKGVPQARLRPTGKGESSPVAPNHDEEGRRRNRRVDFVNLGQNP